MEITAQVATWVFSVFGIFGLGALAAYAAFRYLGTKWLDTKFQERLEAYKHEQQKELEELRFKINALMDRSVKLHQREFDVLPETWGRLIDAFGQAQSVTSAFQQYPDVSRMDTPLLEEFLAKSPLRESEKDELRRAKDRTKYYIKVITWHRIVDARVKLNEYRVYLLKNGIFMPAELKGKFDALDSLIFDALIEDEMNERDEIFPKPRKAADDLAKTGGQLIKSLEQAVHARFWSADATTI